MRATSPRTPRCASCAPWPTPERWSGITISDWSVSFPPTLSIVLDQVRIAVVHDSGPARGRAGRLRRRFPDADVVVFGHSHVPIDERGLEGQLLFNPGSPTQRRQQPARTFGRLRIEDHRLQAHTIEVLDD